MNAPRNDEEKGGYGILVVGLTLIIVGGGSAAAYLKVSGRLDKWLASNAALPEGGAGTDAAAPDARSDLPKDSPTTQGAHLDSEAYAADLDNVPVSPRDEVELRRATAAGADTDGPSEDGSAAAEGFSREPAETETSITDERAGPARPSPRVSMLIEQLRSNSPNDSRLASQELGDLGAEAHPACEALVETLLRDDSPWREARLAAAEALEKIHPRLFKPVWKMILEKMTDVGSIGNAAPQFGTNEASPPLDQIVALGTDGRGALPLLLAYWRRPEEEGFRIYDQFLRAMHIVAPGDPIATEQVVGVLEGKISVGETTLWHAMELVDRLGLSDQEVADLLVPYLQDKRQAPAVAPQLSEMVQEERLDPEVVVKALLKRLELEMADSSSRAGDREFVIHELVKLGPDAREALPALKTLKFEDPDESVREAAAAAMRQLDDA